MPSAAAAAQQGNRLQAGGRNLFIYMGQGDDTPTAWKMVANPSIVRDRSAQFDGSAVYMPNVISNVIRPVTLSQATIQAELTGWSAADFGTHTHNWALVYWWGNNYGHPPDAPVTDWTNDAHWATIAQNWGNLATVLRQVGKFDGIWFDNEAYLSGTWTQNTYPFNWGGDSNQPNDTAPNGLGVAPTLSRPQFRTQVQARGKQCMDAVLTAWPECQVIHLHSAFASDWTGGEGIARYMPWNNIWWTSEGKGPFFYGFLQSVNERNQGALWDGGEMYGIRTQLQQYQAARYRQFEYPREPGQWVYVDPLTQHRPLQSNGLWDVDEFDGTDHTPAELKNLIIYGMRENNGLLWLYTEHFNWYGSAGSGKPAISQAYLDAVAEARAIGRGGASTSGGTSSYNHNGSDVLVLVDASSHNYTAAGGGGTFSDDFTGSDGADPAGPWTVSVTTGADVDIQGNRLRMVTGSTADQRAGAFYGILANGEVTIKASFPNPATTPTYLNFLFRADDWSGNFDFPQNGYYIDLVPGDGAAYAYRLVSSGFTFLSSLGFTFSNGTDVWLKVRWNGTTIQARLWNDGASEPSTWNVMDTTDATYSTGKWGLSASSATADSKTIYWDSMSGTSL